MGPDGIPAWFCGAYCCPGGLFGFAFGFAFEFWGGWAGRIVGCGWCAGIAMGMFCTVGKLLYGLGCVVLGGLFVVAAAGCGGWGL